MLNSRAQRLIEDARKDNGDSAVLVRQGFEKFERRNAARGMDRVLGEALEKGAKRSPREIHVFVHHTEPVGSIPPKLLAYSMLERGYPFSVMHKIHEYLERYQQALLSVLDTGADPIVIETGLPMASCAAEDIHPRLLLPQSRRCTSIIMEGYERRATGFLGEAEFAKFLRFSEGLHEDDRFVLDGGYAGACIVQFAVKLAAAKLFGQHQVAPFVEAPHEFQLDEVEAFAMQNAWENARVYKASGVRLGSVFDRHNARSVPGVGEVIRQMTDEQTIIIPDAPAK